jgi:CheY-like chemotaxis protein
MDINMPMLTGRQACQLIRLMQFGVNPWATRLPIIALTANAMDSELRKCIDAGMTACLTKPVPHQALVDIVANSLRHCRQAEYRPSADELVACTDQLAQIESSLPLLREFSTLVIAALQHSVGVREDFEARTGALLGCLAWALKLIGSYAAQREIERFLQREAGAPELQLAEAARELLDEHAQAWLEQFSNVPARLDSRRDQRNGARRLSADRLLAGLEGDY